MDKWEDKLEKMALQTVNENVTSISGVPTWTLILFKRLLEMTGKKTIAEIWPDLELYMHGGVSFTPYREQFKNLIGKPIHYLKPIMPAKAFLRLMRCLEMKGWPCLPITAFSWSLCP